MFHKIIPQMNKSFIKFGKEKSDTWSQKILLNLLLMLQVPFERISKNGLTWYGMFKLWREKEANL